MMLSDVRKRFGSRVSDMLCRDGDWRALENIPDVDDPYNGGIPRPSHHIHQGRQGASYYWTEDIVRFVAKVGSTKVIKEVMES